MSPSRLRRSQRRERRAAARIAMRPKFSADILRAWDHARWVWNTFCFLLFHPPRDLALREYIGRREARGFQDWLRGMELLTRRIILAAALAMTVVLKPLGARQPAPRKRRLRLVWPQKPATWIARFCVVPPQRRETRRVYTNKRELPPVVPSFPLARRLEAIRRVLDRPEPRARRFALKLARIAQRNARANAPRRFTTTNLATSKAKTANRVASRAATLRHVLTLNRKKRIKTTSGTVNRNWHGGCKQVFNGEANAEWRSRKTRNGDKKMNGLIKQTKLDAVNQLGSFAIAFFGVIAVVYMFVGTSV